MSYTAPAPTAVDFSLVSGYTAPAASAVDFTYGSSPVTLSAAGGVTIAGSAVIFDPPLRATGTISVGWVQVYRPPPVVRVGLDVSLGLPYNDPPRKNVGSGLSFDAYRHLDTGLELRMVPPPARSDAVDVYWEAIPKKEQSTSDAWSDTVLFPQRGAGPGWHDLPKHDAQIDSPWDQSIKPTGSRPADAWIVPRWRDFTWELPYDHTDVYRTEGYRPPPYVPPAGRHVNLDLVSGYTVPEGRHVDFNLRDPEPNHRIGPRAGFSIDTWNPKPLRHNPGDTLPWGPQGRRDSVGITIDYPQQPPEPPHEPPPLPPEKRYYLLMPSISATRVSDGAAILVNTARVSTDRDSWCWQLDATLARGEDLALVMPGVGGPVEIEITINGHAWRFLVESYRRQRAYNSSTYQIQGRSPSASLAAPYGSPRTQTEASAKTAQQLADAELQFSGWTLTWLTETWSVPGGTWSYQDLTPMQAILRIAESVGAVVYTDPTAKTLTVAPRYVTSPWEWSDVGTVADVALIESQLLSLSMDWAPGPGHTAVYVSGKQNGVLVHVLLGGTAMDSEAPQVVDELVTNRLAGRERGRQLLADAGNRANVSIQTLMLPDPEPPGLILPGTLVEVHEAGEVWNGQAMSVNIEASRQNATTVRQSIEVERWYG